MNGLAPTVTSADLIGLAINRTAKMLAAEMRPELKAKLEDYLKTRYAKLLVAAEALTVIIFSGLFLNALAYRAANPDPKV